ncbi:hypothetical protein PAECIP111893_03369 [Paenibacillus plantiphilus]|uniref:KTSC domain-containing protein n=1 Tax=Paenibacillus plantiphilus TaxID=2905650 RepID=A0ABN8GK82_9BACL|nr:hypothetical protein [Paenibacillus plantiphilus]CAH1211068.1 hypothetical protein PAECIP111893_03369 [Paenibacillus plantiphilus]
MLVPVESKQIAFCSYDEKEEKLHLYYHTGEVTTFSSIVRAEFQAVLESSNRYDALMRVARKYEPVTVVDETPTEAEIPVWNNL